MVYLQHRLMSMKFIKSNMINQKIITFLLFLIFSNLGFAQTNQNWNWLIGNWEGIGNGKPGEGKGVFSFEYQLDQNVIVRKSRSEYPSRDSKKMTVHDDLLVVYLDENKNLSKAIYFDNEGHVINYSITYTEKTITFLSETKPDQPTFRLIYSLLENNEVNTAFEISMDGKNFKTYIKGKSKKI